MFPTIEAELSSSKLRSAVVLAHAGGVDWLLCQVTSNPYGDLNAVALTGSSFASGGLNRDSFARQGKLFTASASIVIREAGALLPEARRAVVTSVVNLLESALR